MAQYSLSTATNVFKTKYVKFSRDMFNSENVVLAKIKRNDNFVGDPAQITVPTSFGGGRGSSVLPRANVTSYEKMLISSKKTYALIEIDNEAIKASQSDEGAFVRMSKEPVKRGVQSWQGNASRMLFNNSLDTTGNGGNGRLGRFTTNPTNTATDTYTCVIDASFWKLANFEPKDYVNVNTNTAEFEITAVAADTRTVTLVQRVGSTFNLAGQASGDIYMQNSRNGDPTGFDGVVRATTGTIFNIAIGYRWQASSQINAASAGITPDLLNQVNLDIKYKFGETPDMLITSFVQYRKLLNQLEDQKRYMIVESRNSGPKGKFSFQALEFMADTGPLPVVAERFAPDDTLYAMNSDFVEMHARPDGGWIENPETGSMFFPSATTDAWQARYGVYFEFGTVPTAHGLIYSLSTT